MKTRTKVLATLAGSFLISLSVLLFFFFINKVYSTKGCIVYKGTVIEAGSDFKTDYVEDELVEQEFPWCAVITNGHVIVKQVKFRFYEGEKVNVIYDKGLFIGEFYNRIEPKEDKKE